MALFGIVAAMSLTAAGSPAPSPSPSETLHGGVEGAKAALVRIELRAVTEIAHIDHSTGEVEISRGRSTVPLGSATGVVVSADGIVATTWENLAIDDGAVAVYAANELFTKVIGAPVVGNDGNPARRGITLDHHWGPHLQHCYDQVSHCVLFRVPQYDVRTYTSEPGGVMAELLNTPSKPNDVALLRISGGGAAPTATLDAPDAAAGADAALFGFTERPAITAGPAEIPVTVDASAARISSLQALSGPLDAGLTGGPVLDRTTGRILGLAGPRQPDGAAALVPAAAIQAAMAEAGLKASPSKFDAVFRRGIDHLASGNPGGSAESELEESLTYYDSALATSRLGQAKAMRTAKATESPAKADAKVENALPAAVVPLLAGGLVLAGVVGAFAYRRRAASAAAPADGAAQAKGISRPQPTPARAGPGISAKPSVAGDKGTARTPAAINGKQIDRQEPVHGGTGSALTGSARTEAAQHQSPSSRTPPAPGQQAPLAPDTNPKANANEHPGPYGDETQTAGPMAPPLARGMSTAFCSQCGRTVRPGARFCVGCGRPVG